MSSWYHEDSSKQLKKIKEQKLPGRTVADSQFSVRDDDDASSTLSSRQDLPKSKPKAVIQAEERAAELERLETQEPFSKTLFQELKSIFCCRCFFHSSNSQSETQTK